MRFNIIINKVAGSLSLAVGLLASLALLLALVSTSLGHKLPALPSLHYSGDPMAKTIPVDKIQQLSSKSALAQSRPFAKGSHPFFTSHFQPPPPPPPVVAPTPAPAPAPDPTPAPPPPPPMKKVALLFQGVYRTAEGQNRAFVQTDGKLAVLPMGEKVANDWTIAEIGLQKLTLTNAAAQTTILEFNRVKELEVPVK